MGAIANTAIRSVKDEDGFAALVALLEAEQQNSAPNLLAMDKFIQAFTLNNHEDPTQMLSLLWTTIQFRNSTQERENIRLGTANTDHKVNDVDVLRIIKKSMINTKESGDFQVVSYPIYQSIFAKVNALTDKELLNDYLPTTKLSQAIQEAYSRAVSEGNVKFTKRGNRSNASSSGSQEQNPKKDVIQESNNNSNNSNSSTKVAEITANSVSKAISEKTDAQKRSFAIKSQLLSNSEYQLLENIRKNPDQYKGGKKTGELRPPYSRTDDWAADIVCKS